MGAKMQLQVINGGRTAGQPKQEGFIQVFSALVRTKELSNAAFRTYCLLLDYCWQGKQECNPAQDTLAEILGVKRNTVRRSLDELEEFDLISVKPDRNGGSNVYRLNRVVKVDRGIKNDPPDQPGVIDSGGSGGSKMIPESHDQNHINFKHTTHGAVVGDASPVEKDPWNEPSSSSETAPVQSTLKQPSPETSSEVTRSEVAQISEMLLVARVLENQVPGLVAEVVKAGRDAAYVRRVIVASCDPEIKKPPNWIIWALRSNYDPPRPGSSVWSAGGEEARPATGIYEFRGAEVLRRERALGFAPALELEQGGHSDGLE